ncbi:protein suppressor of white apricot [Scaptodrosophila lebanonensis]|uniref:Protein suppressor of white apricot n=1 Tax=Drosophila lebanonensis TaxID=7225 RepID=A0A6J2TZV7_DROLE|nr:protein suppressor of white apricot [Scaptodrosophila lebanonensis]
MLPYNIRAGDSSAMAREYAGGSVSGILRKTGTAAAGGGGLGGGVAANVVASSTTSATMAGSTAYGAAATALDARQPPVELLVFGYACKIFRDDEKARELDHGKHLIPWMGDVNLKIDRYDVRGALCDLSSFEAPPGGYGNRLEYLTAEEQRAEQLCEEERYLFLYKNEEEHKLQQEEDLKRLQQETSGGNYSQVGFQYDGQSQAAPVPTSATVAPSSPTSEENEQPYILPATLLEIPPPGMLVPETMKQHAIIEKTARFIAMQGAQMEILIKAKQSNNPQFDFLTQGGLLQPYYRHLLAAIKQGKYAPAPEPAAETPGETTNPPSPKRLNVITVPTIKYKPSANCAYTQLISKIKGVPLQAVLDDEGSASNSQHSAGTASPTPSCKSSQSSEFMPVLLQYNGSTFAHAPLEEPDEDNANDAPPKVELLKSTSALALAQDYSSESEADEQEQQQQQQQQQQPPPKKKLNLAEAPLHETKPPALLTFPLPEENLRHIIDKTATYVIKNGRQFEETLRTKSVERFNFLLPSNEYYPYYMFKITGDVDAASKEEKTRKAAAVAAALMSKKGLTFGGAAAAAAAEKAPVSFSIRARDEQAPLQSTLPQEASDDEEDGKAGAATSASGNESSRPGMPDSVQRAIKQVETQLLARSGGGQKPMVTTLPATMGTASPTAPHKDQRQAEERFKDKLAQIAREKLNGLITREKQLQLERKRKAMAFLNQIKGEAAGSSSVSETAATKDGLVEGGEGEDSNDSVRSIPITYFGPDEDEDEQEDNVAKEGTKTAADDDDEEGGGDLEKYNLLNDDSTNTFTSKAPPALPSVLLSDDDDVQLVAAGTAPTTAARSRVRSRSSRHRSSSRSTLLDASESSSGSDSGGSSESGSPGRSHSRGKSRSRSYRQRRKRKAGDDLSMPTPTKTHDRKHRRRGYRSTTRSPAQQRRHKQRSRSRSRSHSERSRSRSVVVSSDEEPRYHHRHHHYAHHDHHDHHREERQRSRHASRKSHKRHKRRRRSSDGSH